MNVQFWFYCEKNILYIEVSKIQIIQKRTINFIVVANAIDRRVI